MQAIRLTKSSVGTPNISVENVQIPKADADHVVVKIKAAAIQPSDRMNAKGGFGTANFPRTPGRDFAGIVVDGPPEMLNQEVFGTGGALLGFTDDGPHAEYCLVHKDLLAPKPPNMSFVETSVIGVPYSTALLCLRRARLTSNDSVLVIGSTGAVGTAATQLAKALGAKQVYGAARHDTADVNMVSDPTFSALDRLTGGRGVDVIVDTVGSIEVMTAAGHHLASRGRYTWISAPRTPGVPMEFSFNLLDAYRKELEFVGCNSAASTTFEVGTDLKHLSSLFASGSCHAHDEKSLEQTSLTDAVATYQTGKKLQVIVFP